MSVHTQQRFTDRVVIVTGASGGFGLATARAFANEGATVVLAARSLERCAVVATELQQSTGSHALAVRCDVIERDQVDRLIHRVIDQFGHIDILVNNAGVGLIAPVERIQPADAKTVFDTNFHGAFNCTQAALPYLKLRHGQIVNMASVAGLRGIPNSSMYCASKAALIAFSDALRLELRACGVSVTTICPSRTNDTDFIAHARTYGPIALYRVPETLTTEMVVTALLDATARRKPMVILPFHARLLHLASKFAPQLVDDYLYKRMPKLPVHSDEALPQGK